MRISNSILDELIADPDLYERYPGVVIEALKELRERRQREFVAQHVWCAPCQKHVILHDGVCPLCDGHDFRD